MKLTSQTGPYPQSKTWPDSINLALGQPSPSLLPIDEIARATQAGLGQELDPLVLQYGAMDGYEGFREDLAAFLSERYQFPVGAEELFITGGNSLAISMAAQVLTADARRAGHSPRVVLEDPTYFLAKGIFDTLGLDHATVVIDEAGLDTEALEALLQNQRADNRVAFVYCIPAFHNPTGVDLSPERARHLIALAEEHDFVVVADEPYPLLWFGEDRRPKPLVAYDEGRGRVLSLGSFSKILGPGLRLGWAHAAPALLKRLRAHGTVMSGGCLNPVVARIVHETIRSGFLGLHITHLQQTFAGRARTLADALRDALRVDEATLGTPAGGYFMWVPLPAGVDVAALHKAGKERLGVGFAPGPRCGIEHDFSRFIRLSFSFYDEPALCEGVKRISVGIREQLST